MSQQKKTYRPVKKDWEFYRWKYCINLINEAAGKEKEKRKKKTKNKKTREPY